ncbi:pas domain s-box [Halogeometricum borinquense DSM 11551]|uniref:histidine kinase n=1 Tax=Halogeometricum borinquense (strain ATCC 700274 / DSM 11551 / JCM 10706 / KCTC 4070 / PR3) TaxID=469382 RepID=E4NRL8_HALBP|nr:PAS domain S-box protein [Halogeometricum borinquense]ADQ65694.1 PAS domain S-box [Halogeometricum borinquense DSM 11551]ELY27024.1 pas domain s-box [Halogeometricum borinquense DSM 11551]
MTRDAETVTVLCVDDEPGSADLTAAYLERHDDRLTVTTATSVQGGLNALTETDFDCIVSDYDMPGLDGLAFLEAVRVDRPKLPFILFTGKGSEAVASEAISAGVSDYVQKESGTDQYPALARRIHNAVERFRADKHAAKVQEEAKSILENSPDAIVVSVGDEFVFANTSAVSLFEADDADDLLGRNLLSLIHKQDTEAVKAVIAHAQDDEKVISQTQRTMKTLDGMTFSAEMTVRAITWNGESGHVAILRDVTNQEEQDYERERYAAAFSRAMDAIIVADDDDEFIDVNGSAAELFGLPREELLGRNLSEFTPNGSEIDDMWADFQSLGENHGVLSLIRPDGERRVVEYAATRDVVPGEHLSVLRDVTGRTRLERQRQADHEALERMYRITADREAAFEEKVSALLELGADYLDVPYGFLTRIQDGTQTIIESVGDHELLQPGETGPLSKAYCRKTVIEDELVSVQNSEAEGWEDDPAYERYELGCYIGAKVIVNEDLFGTLCFAGTASRKQAFSHGEEAFVELLARWVSYEQEHRRNNRELQSQTERLEEFASMVTHDLRNPLSVASGYLELAREDGDPEQFDRIEDALSRMERIIGDLLYLARENEQIRETEPVELESAVERAWQTVDETTHEATLSVDGDIGTIEADQNRLCQLLENLFRNAIDHVGTDVRVRVGSLDDGFYVEDDGPGIPESERDNVFEQGYTTRNDGTGFGLSIVTEIVEGHGWSIAVTEGELGGARFEISDVHSDEKPDAA